MQYDKSDRETQRESKGVEPRCQREKTKKLNNYQSGDFSSSSLHKYVLTNFYSMQNVLVNAILNMIKKPYSLHLVKNVGMHGAMTECEISKNKNKISYIIMHDLPDFTVAGSCKVLHDEYS